MGPSSRSGSRTPVFVNAVLSRSEGGPGRALPDQAADLVEAASVDLPVRQEPSRSHRGVNHDIDLPSFFQAGIASAGPGRPIGKAENFA
jgi:hypothetical protein